MPIFNCEIPDKCVICIAPHTSNWDFIAGILFKMAYKIQSSFFIKDYWFRFPLKTILKKLGGMPIKRDKRQSTTDLLALEFAGKEVFRIAITPEGTRKPNPDWKLGFYCIALKAQVPILLVAIDYKTKTINVGKLFFPTGDVQKDILKIKAFYKIFTGKFPERFAV
jgi:1-acyl-sn-glycerol-3-phosphate acyltransferase